MIRAKASEHTCCMLAPAWGSRSVSPSTNGRGMADGAGKSHRGGPDNGGGPCEGLNWAHS